MRLALAALIAALGYLSVVRSAAELIKWHDPLRAHRMAPNDGRITALLAQRQFADGAGSGNVAGTAKLALLALQQDPTAVQALTSLGLVAQLRSRPQEARRLFAYAERLSRRHLETQVWAIEDAVSRGDIGGAMRHYDIALRTSRTAPDLLFPVLAGAIGEPAIRRNLALTLAQRPVWAPAFLSFLSGNGVDPGSTALLLDQLRRRGASVPADVAAAVINGLVEAGRVGEAWSFYAALRPGADRRRSRDPNFSADLTSPSVLDWTPANDAVVVSSIQRGERGGVFDFSVPSSAGGLLLKQVQLLPPGSYRLAGQTTGIDQPPSATPYWVLTCQGARELGRVELPKSSEHNGTFSGRFDVPADCPVQVLSLVARPSDAPSGNTGQVERVQLIPAP